MSAAEVFSYPRGVLADDVFHDGLHEPQLEVEWCLDTLEGKPQQSVADAFRQPRGKAFHQHIKLAVVKQVFERLLHLLRLIRPNLIKLLRYLHILPRSSVFIRC